MANHGIYVTQKDTAVATPSTANSGIPFVVGAAPLSSAEHPATAGVPVICSSWAEYEDAFGYSDDWAKYTICEFAYSHFKLYACQPVIFLAVGETATAATVASAMESVELCLTMFGIVPDMICAPGFSNVATVAAAMSAKAGSINGMFKAKALVDIDGDSYTDAVTAKNGGSFTVNQIVCWPMGKLGNLKFHMSTVIAGRIASTDVANSGIPYESPSNKAVQLDGLCNADGDAVNLTLAQANILNGAGITTAINFMSSFVAWGNYTGAYPTSSDVKDYFIPVSRMFGYINNGLIKTFWSYLDKPMSRRLIDTILDSSNIWLNGLVGQGYLLGARVEMVESENPLTNLLGGIIKLHVYITPPSPAQEIDFVMEYDASYVKSSLQA